MIVYKVYLFRLIMYKEPWRLHSAQVRMEWTSEVSAILIPESKPVTWAQTE